MAKQEETTMDKELQHNRNLYVLQTQTLMFPSARWSGQKPMLRLRAPSSPPFPSL